MRKEDGVETGTVSILVVEDEAGVRTTLCAILEEAGYEVRGAGNGTEALEMIGTHPFNAVIMDIRLPDVDGTVVLEQAKEMEPDVAVIMMTGYASLETAVEAVNAGAYAYFVKPVNIDEMKTAISNALKQQRLSRENRRLVDNLQRSNRQLRVEINERRQAEELFTNLSNSSPIGIFIVEGRRFKYINRQFQEYSGYSEDELLESDPSRLVYPEDRELVRENAIKMLKGGCSSPYEYRGVNKDGKTLWVMETVTSIKYQGRRAVLGNYMDVTRHKQAEQKIEGMNERLAVQNEELEAQRVEVIEKSQEVERASQAKSAFLASMSHELRTPLNVIIGFSQLLMDGVPGGINDEQKQCLGDVLNSGAHLLSLINDVLDLSKVEAGKLEIKLENFNLAEVIEDVVKTVKPMLDNNEHRLAVSIDEELPHVYADKGKLRQVFLNLVGNAIKFTPSGGQLGISVSGDGDWCRVSVSDNGVGIGKEDRERIFEPFTQVDFPPGKKKEGTGLGLALTRQFLKMCGGSIWVQSEYGKGSEFIFTLPLAANDSGREQRGG